MHFFVLRDILENIVRRGHCYTYLAIGGPISLGTLRVSLCRTTPFSEHSRESSGLKGPRDACSRSGCLQCKSVFSPTPLIASQAAWFRMETGRK